MDCTQFTKKTISFLFIVVLSVGIVFSQSSTNYTIKRSVMAQGGNQSQSTDFKIVDVIGQPGPVGLAASSNYNIFSGFLTEEQYATNVEENNESILPSAFKLLQNFPNPFNPVTTIEYHLPHGADVFMTIFDTRGQQVQQLISDKKPAGCYTVRWDGRDRNGHSVASGVYFYRIVAKGNNQRFINIKKMIFIK